VRETDVRLVELRTKPGEIDVRPNAPRAKIERINAWLETTDIGPARPRAGRDRMSSKADEKASRPRWTLAEADETDAFPTSTRADSDTHPIDTTTNEVNIMANINRATTQARDAQVIAGIEKHLPNTPSLPLVGSSYTPANLVKLFQGRIDSANTTAAAKANWHSTVVTGKAGSTKLTPILRALRQYVMNVFGETSPVLSDFGFSPPKRATRTPEQKAASAAKAKATRQARHTMGKKQKKNVKGSVTATLLVTPTNASPPAVSPAAALGATAAATPAPGAAPAGGPAPVPAVAPAGVPAGSLGKAS
jgi:hypothetical protein